VVCVGGGGGGGGAGGGGGGGGPRPLPASLPPPTPVPSHPKAGGAGRGVSRRAFQGWGPFLRLGVPGALLMPGPFLVPGLVGLTEVLSYSYLCEVSACLFNRRLP